MLELLTCLLFLTVSVPTAFLCLRLWSRRTRAVDRLAARHVTVSSFLPSPSLIWSELASRVGSMVPATSKVAPQLRRRLIRAGFRNPSAVRFFRGIRAVSTGAFAILDLLWSMRSYTPLDNLLLLTGAAAMIGYIAPMQVLLVRIRRRQRRIEKGLPNALDLLVVCVEAGLGLDQAILQVAKELLFAYPDLCEELTVVNLEIRAGKKRADALHNLADRTGVEELKKLVAVLIQTDRFGTSIAQSLRGHADYMRVMARQKAEEKASKLAVKLVFPIFFCVLPSLFVVTVGPVMTRMFRDLWPVIENM
jgi:tight adherence protein C